ncbi:hypothetical protein [Actinopolymorpha sp. B9G3]|uniref:hypothetical protein n=1 Tax=Actinopolymorpha sp. B9G3 TaxID=3158970 RepID=UPI0032D8F07E
MRVDRPRLGVPAWARSFAAAGGAAAGALLAVPVGGFLIVVLFERIGTAIIRDITSGAVTDDMSGVEAVIAAVFLLLTAVLVAILVVVALVTPVFVILPMAATALALRLAGAGLIARSLLVGLGLVIGLAAGVGAASSSVDIDMDLWIWILVAAAGAFGGRLVVELWKPDDAGRVDGATGRRRWSRLGVAWAALLALAIVLILLLVKLLPVSLGELVLR